MSTYRGRRSPTPPACSSAWASPGRPHRDHRARMGGTAAPETRSDWCRRGQLDRPACYVVSFVHRARGRRARASFGVVRTAAATSGSLGSHLVTPSQIGVDNTVFDHEPEDGRCRLRPSTSPRRPVRDGPRRRRRHLQGRRRLLALADPARTGGTLARRRRRLGCVECPWHRAAPARDGEGQQGPAVARSLATTHGSSTASSKSAQAGGGARPRVANAGLAVGIV